MSSEFSDEEINQIEIIISKERLSKLVALTGSKRIAIEIHLETLSLNAKLMNIIAIIELALRNAVNENLTLYFGTRQWLIQTPAPFKWEKLEANKLHNAIRDAKTRRKHTKLTQGQVIAEVTFHFWKKLFGSDYEQTLWRTTLKKIFPDKSIKRPFVAQQLEHIYQSRNRLAHHEPVLNQRFYQTILAVHFVCESLNAKIPSKNTPLAKILSEKISEAEEKAKLLHERLNSFRK